MNLFFIISLIVISLLLFLIVSGLILYSILLKALDLKYDIEVDKHGHVVLLKSLKTTSTCALDLRGSVRVFNKFFDKKIMKQILRMS